MRAEGYGAGQGRHLPGLQEVNVAASRLDSLTSERLPHNPSTWP